MRYFRKRCDEVVAQESWGGSVWWFEIDDELNVVRQIEVYDSGVVLTYDLDHLGDDHGGLSEKPLPYDEEFQCFEILAAEFEQRWSTPAYNRG